MKETISLSRKLLCVALLAFVSGCSGNSETQHAKNESSFAGPHSPAETASTALSSSQDCSVKLADMSGYATYDENADYHFIDSNIDEFFDLIENDRTFVAYMGYQDCNMCNQAMPVLNEVAERNNTYVFYMNTSDEDDWVSPRAEYPIMKFAEYLDGYLSYDEEGYPEIYVPLVIFVNNGDVVMAHEGIPTEGGFDGTLNDEQSAKLHNIYEDGFARIAG